MRFRFKPIRSIALCAVAVLTTSCPQDRPLKNGLTVDDDNQTTSISSDVQNFTAPTYQVDGGGTLPAVQEEDLKNFVVTCFSREKGNANSIEITITPDGVFSVFTKEANPNNVPSVNLFYIDGHSEGYGDIQAGRAYGFYEENLRAIEVFFPDSKESIKISHPDSGVYMVQDAIGTSPIIRLKIYPDTNRVVGYETSNEKPVVITTLIDIDGSLIPKAFAYQKVGNMVDIRPRDANGHGFTDQVITVDDTLAERTCAVSHTQEVFR